jgi:aryl-alcohol dehydrogenase-like predicted oxidoreductase
MSYSLVGRDIEYEIVPFLQEAGLGLLVWSPLAGGFLTGKYTRENPTGDNGRLASFDIMPIDREMGYKVVDLPREIAGVHQRATPAQVALAWLLSKPFVTSVD